MVVLLSTLLIIISCLMMVAAIIKTERAEVIQSEAMRERRRYKQLKAMYKFSHRGIKEHVIMSKSIMGHPIMKPRKPKKES